MPVWERAANATELIGAKVCLRESTGQQPHPCRSGQLCHPPACRGPLFGISIPWLNISREPYEQLQMEVGNAGEAGRACSNCLC